MAIVSTRLFGLCLASALLASAGTAMAQGVKVVRFLHNETDPPSMAFFNKAIADFERLNPNIKIEMESVSTDGRLQKVTASMNAKTMPEVFKILAEERMQFARKGYLVPLDNMVASIGANDYLDDLIVKVDGKIYDVPYTINNFSVLFYRDDLLKAANLTPPKNWNELKAAAQALNKGDVNGFVLPAGQNRATSLYLASLVWSAGGTFFDKDLKVTFNSPATVAALAFMKDMAAVSPKGIAAYSYGDMINVYLTGKVALDLYAPRLVATGYDTVPAVATQTKAVVMPVGPSGHAVKFISPNSFAIASPAVGAKNTAEAQKFLEFIVSGERLRDLSLTVFPHMIPPLKSVQAMVIDAAKDKLGGGSNPAELGKVSFDLSNSMSFEDEAGASWVDGKLVKAGLDNPYIGAIVARHIPAQVVQRVLINGEAPAAAAAWGAQEMQKIVDDLKRSAR
ncbi:MAG: sugar ABC transporter substrate-binding protein [Telmatospirillum sp.]|nr:sugar ABC transporter substrate-binding protein [Telmatospirillum sp.]